MRICKSAKSNSFDQSYLYLIQLSIDFS